MQLLPTSMLRALTLGLVLGLVFCVLDSPMARARTPLEREWARYNDWQLDWFRLEGTPSGLEKPLKSGLALAGRSRFLRGPDLPLLTTRLLQEDLARIRLFLAQEGYPAATVEPEAFPVMGEKQLGLTLHIDPGPAVMVETINYPGWPESTAQPDSTASELVQIGQRFRDTRLETARNYLRRTLRNRGFALAEVTATARPLTATEVEVVFQIVPGESFDIAEIKVSGGSPDLQDLTHRLLDMDPPLTFSQARLDQAALNLRSTQLYRQVAFDLVPIAPGKLRLDLTVGNARMRSVEASVGTWSDNPWRVRVGWNHRNLLGRGRGVDAQASLATHTQSIGGGLSRFGWLSARGRTRLGVEWRREDEEAYLSKEWKLNLVESMPMKGNGMVNLGISLSRVSLTPYGEPDQNTLQGLDNLLEFWANRKWDWTNNPQFPTRGGFLKLTGTLSPPNGLTESAYVLAQSDISLYRPLAGGAVLAGRLRAGWARPLGQAESVIPNRRFYAGGYSTMRGYGRRQLGPRDAENVAQGGQAVLLGGLETRIPVVWIIEMALFVDTGQVWWRPSDVRLADLATATGAVLDLRTPLGPVRFGYAWNLGSVQPGEPRSLAHFGMGYPW